MKIKILLMVAAVMIAVAATPRQSEAATMGCLLGAAGGGFGGSQFGKGSGKLAMTALGTLLGCGAGSAIQDRDQQQYQQQYAPRYRYQQQPRQQFRSRYGEYRQQQIIYQQPAPRVVYQLPAPRSAPAQRACPYSREYQDTVTIGGKQVPAYGQACSYDGGQNWDLGPLTPSII